MATVDILDNTADLVGAVWAPEGAATAYYVLASGTLPDFLERGEPYALEWDDRPDEVLHGSTVVGFANFVVEVSEGQLNPGRMWIVRYREVDGWVSEQVLGGKAWLRRTIEEVSEGSSDKVATFYVSARRPASLPRHGPCYAVAASSSLALASFHASGSRARTSLAGCVWTRSSTSVR